MGALSLVIFIILVAIGLPVLTGGRGGIAVLIGPSAGYIFSFPIAAGLIGWYSEKSGRRSELEADSDQHNLWCITSESDWCTSHGINNQYVDLGWTCRSVSLSSGDIIKAVIAAVITMQLKAISPIEEKTQI